MKEMKRFLSLLLCLVMLVGSMPVSAFATETGDTQPTTVTEPVVLNTGDGNGTTTETTASTETTETTASTETTETTETTASTESTESTETTASTEATETTEATEPEETTPAKKPPIIFGATSEKAMVSDNQNIQVDDAVLQILAVSDYAGSMADVMEQVQSACGDVDRMMFLGDSTDATALLDEAKGYYTYDAEAILVQGDQDEMNEDLIAGSGSHDADSYGVFVINEEAYEDGLTAILSELEAYLEEKVKAGFDQPVFVLSHRGLHYGSGNENARDLFEILNKAGEEDLTIVYVYGQTDDDYVGETAVYLPVGDQINIAESETYAEETLAFTYMNAGAAAENATVFTFGEDTVSVSRYDAQGLSQLKDAGVADELMVADLETYESPAVIKITVPTVVVEETVPETTEPVVQAPVDPYAEQRALYEKLSAELAASHQLAMEKAAAAAETPAETSVDAETDITFESSSEEVYNVSAQSDEPIYILAGGDFQEAGDHANSAANVTNILAQVGQNYQTMDGFLFIGDYDCETHNSATETANGITALMGAVQGKYSNLNDANSVLVQGNHDYMDSRIDATGGHDFDGYSVYVLNEDDYPNEGGSQSGIQTLANNLKTWLNNKIGEGYSAPIFITSHLPLAFTPRTVTQGDAKYAKYIFDVLNDAAKNGLNIIFMHGHDHAYGPDNYMGGEAIYLPKGDKICIAEAGSTSAWTEETLNFTYMNAGYTGYYSDPYTYVTTAGTDKLTMTVFAITGSEVTVERYSANGAYNLKSAGYDGSYSDTSVTNKSLGLPTYSAVYASPQTIALSTVETYGDIGSYVGVTEDVTDDVTTSGGDWVEISPPIPGTEATPDVTTYKYVLDTDGVNTNTKYLIVNTSSNGTAYALTNNNGSVTRTQVTINNGEIIVDNETNVNWIFSGTNSGTVVNQGRYIYPNNGSISLNTDGSNMTISNEGNGEYQIYRRQNQNSGYYYWIEYDNGWTGARAYQSGSRGSVYLFAYKKDIVTPGTEATPGTNGLYGKVVGDLSYTVSAGTSADAALAAVKAGLDGYYYEAMSTPDVTGNIVDDSVLTWTLDPNYNGNVPGDYAVTISYNGVTLGTAEVIVPPATTYYIAEGNGLYIVDMNTSAENALAKVKEGVTVYSATDASGTGKTAISDSDVTWNWVDAYNGADSGPYTVEILYKGTSLGTVEVKVNVQYETGINSDWTYIGTTEGTGGSHTYTLDTDGIDYGSDNKYIIVARGLPLALNATSTSGSSAETINISGNTATTSTRDYEYYFVEGFGVTKDGTKALYQSSWLVRYDTASSHADSVLNGFTNLGNGYYRLYDTDGTERSLFYINGTHESATNAFTVTNSDHTNSQYSVRLYKYTGTTGGTPGGSVYALLEGKTVYTVEQGTSAAKALAEVKAGITAYTATDANGTGKTELDDNALTYKWKNTYVSMSTGSYWVEISYQGKVLGTVEVQVVPGVVNNYPEYPDEGAVKVNKTGTGIDFQSSGIAQIEVSASGVPLKKGADVIVMLDTSSSMTSHTVTGTSKTRAEVLEESLVDLIAQFKTPGDDGKLLDLKVAIADFNGFYGEDVDNENNNYQTGTPYDRDDGDTMSDGVDYNAVSEAKIYTGDGTLGAGAFIPVDDLAASYTLNYTSGTNYDYAMDAIYQMGTAIKEANGSEDRDLYVIFMSDGAAMQWNYYHSQGASSLWNKWITGAYATDEAASDELSCKTHYYYYDEVDHNGDGMKNEHRMANAIKGDPSTTYEVIRKTNDLGTATGETNMYMVPGLGATMFSISFDAQTDTNVTEDSMDKSIESLASPQTGTIKYYYKVTTADELSSAFDAIGSEIAYAATNARFVDQMGDNYNLQMAVSNYSVVDGDTTTDKSITPKIEIIQYDIYTRQDYLNGTISEDKIGDRKGTYTILETVTFNTDGTEAYSDQIGGGTTNILADGTQTGYVKGVIYAKTFLYNTNITDVAVEGVSIPTGKNPDGTTTGTTNLLPSETFYWKLGTVQTSELAMRYYVYLEGSMEGTREGGSYPTNEFATLYYDNYLGNPCMKDTVSPVMAWKEANVSYAFYLVDENGNIIVNQTTGQTGSFANKIAVTNPVVYETVLLNNDEEVSSIDIASLGVLPEGYELYDVQVNQDGTKTGATYTVTINSNTTGSWAITSEKDVATTYVMQYDPNDPSAYSKELTHNTVGNDYTHTVVWFAVLWKTQALPDTVVVDYGLPVDISVLANDMFGDYGKLTGVGAYSDSLNLSGHDTTLASGFGTNYTGTYGTAKADASTGKVRYTLNTMQMNGYEKFAYAVNYTGNENAGYYYDTVTVIPATTIYYEDSFLTFKKFNADHTENGTWDSEGELVAGATQDEDRPGQYSLTDANNIYGYDGVNLNMSTFSLGQARKIHVDANTYGTAAFTFAGTGFDVVSMTSNTSGVIAVKVTAAEEIRNGEEVLYAKDAKVAAKVVNTYYGYTSEMHKIVYTYNGTEWIAEDQGVAGADAVASEKPAEPKVNDTYTAIEQVWVNTPNVNKSLYQVPVLQIEELPYGKYNVLITATYMAALDKTSAEGYDLYMDAIRIYDPANDGASDGATDTTIENAYKADGEAWPSYIELRNKLINPDDIIETEDGTLGNDDTSTVVEGLVFIDGDEEVGDAQISDYISYGPNNEVYLKPGQRIAFVLDTNVTNSEGENIVDSIHIGIKSADGKPASYTFTNIAQNDFTETNVKKGDYYNVSTKTISTTTDMYYDLTGWKDDIIVISNYTEDTGTIGILSLTNIKATYKENPNAVAVSSDEGLDTASEEGTTSNNKVRMYMTSATANLTLSALNAAAEEGTPEETVPETTVPETTVPETTVPETTVPEETEPETTESGPTEPEETEPETETEEDEVVNTIVSTVKKLVNSFKNFFNKWFR